MSRPIPLGPFDLVEKIGDGGMGEVWRGLHREQRVPVACKVLFAHQARDGEFMDAFRSEVRAVAGLDHPGVITVFDHGAVDGRTERASGGRFVAGSPYLVMELATGGTLADLDVLLPWGQTRGMLLELLDALAHAHARGVVHRDLKRPNVLLEGPDDLRPGLKLTDFGIAQLLTEATDETPALLRENILGSPAYMAPEQFQGRSEDIGPGTDLYALGVLTWILVTGRPPFEGRTFEQYMRLHQEFEPPALDAAVPVPRSLEAWLLKLLEKDPARRFQAAADARAVLAELRDPHDPRIVIVRAEPPPPPRDWRSPDPPARPFRLVGTGLGLWGLRTIPLVGREPQRDLLWQALRDVHDDGKARAVVVHGGAGVGKTRLVRWLAERAQETGAAGLLHSVHAEDEPPGAALSAAVLRSLRATGLTRGALRGRIAQLLATQRQDDPVEVEALLELLHPSPAERPEASVADLPADTGDRERMEVLEALPEQPRPRVRFASNAERFVVLRRFLQRAAAQRPVLLWIDDAHEDPDAPAFVEHLLRWQRVEPSRVLVVMTVRDEALQPGSPRRQAMRSLLDAPGAFHLGVPPLPAADHTRLVEDLLCLGGELAAQVRRRTAGNPLFAVQLVGDWVERRVLIPGPEGFVLRKGESAVLPESIEELWSSRVETMLRALPPGLDRALEVAGALGLEVSAREWIATCDRELGDRPAPDLVEALTRERLARTHPGGWAFVHGMLRESVVRRAQKSRRWARWNRACATTLAELHPPDHPGLQERIGRHLLAAGELEACLEPLLKGADAEAGVSDFGRALRLLALREQAIAAAGRGEDEAWAEGRALQAEILHALGQVREAQEVADRVLELARARLWFQVLAPVLRTEALLAFGQGERDRPVALLKEAMSLYRTARDEQGAGRCLASLSVVFSRRGDSRQAWEFADQAREAYARAGVRGGVADALRLMSTAARFRGDAAESRRLAGKALALFEHVGNRRGCAQAHTELAEVAKFTGDLRGAEGSYRTARDIYRAIGSRQAITMDVNLTLVLLLRRDWAKAERAVQALDRLVDDSTSKAVRLCVALARLLLAGAGGNSEAWDAAFTEAIRLNPGGRMVDPDFAWPAEEAGRAAERQGWPARADGAYGLAVHQWSALGAEGRAARVRAARAALQGTR